MVGAIAVVQPRFSTREIVVDHVNVVPRDVPVDHVVVTPAPVEVPKVTIVPKIVEVERFVPHDAPFNNFTPHDVPVEIPRIVEPAHAAAPARLVSAPPPTAPPQLPEEFRSSPTYRAAEVKGRVIASVDGRALSFEGNNNFLAGPRRPGDGRGCRRPAERFCCGPVCRRPGHVRSGQGGQALELHRIP